MPHHAAGSCLCNGVVFEIEGPLSAVLACHCSQCAKTSGNFAAMTCCANDNLKILPTRHYAGFNRRRLSSAASAVAAAAICSGSRLGATTLTLQRARSISPRASKSASIFSSRRNRISTTWPTGCHRRTNGERGLCLRHPTPLRAAGRMARELRLRLHAVLALPRPSPSRAAYSFAATKPT
jgi:hypothetical protein